MRKLLLLILLLPSSAAIFSQVVVNEFSSSNFTKAPDEDGEYNDWIELYNNSASDVDISHWHLSDNKANLGKWAFPSMSLRKGSYLLVYASGKNRTDVPLRFRTIIDRGEDWQYLVPQSELGDDWKTTGFDAGSWSTGSSGFGYSDDDDNTVLESGIASVFIRKEFTIEDITQVAALVLSIDYDDGFVAYINGHEVARSNLGTISPVPYTQLTGTAQREATMYQGGYPDDFVIANPASVLQNGVNIIAIQGHNSDLSSSDFSLIPMLSIGSVTSDPSYSVPDYIRLKGRSLHTSFKISAEGESLILSRADTSLVDSVSAISLSADISYGRKPDGTTSWFYFGEPTPGSSNTTRGFATISSDTVLFSSKGGYYPGGLTLTLSSVFNSDSIFYTTDGSEPTTSSARYSGPFQLTGNSIIRARSIKYGLLPGAVSTNTYVTTKHTLPVVCLSTDPSNLFDYYTGIYVMGPNAGQDPPYWGANFWEDWERKAHMELYDTDGNRQLDQDIGIKIYGAWSRAFPQKSLALYARREYGKGSFDYKVFSDKPIDKFEALVLRNSGNDWECGKVRDGLTSTLVRDMDIDRMAFQPAVVYINGEYWGVLDLREKVNSNYLAENHFVDPGKVSLLEFNGNIIEGDNTSYIQLLNYMANNTLETESKYKNVAGQMDINNYIQYQLSEIYVNNKDWPGNNIKYWKTSDPGSLWRWIIFDTDFGFNLWEEAAYTFNTLSYALDDNGPDWPNPAWSTLLFRRMASNKGFRDQFSTQYADRLNRNFSAERVTYVIDSIKNVYLPEMHAHTERWEQDYDYWDYNYTTIKNFGSYRPDYARSHLRTQFDLGTPLNIKVEIADPGTGVVQVNTIIPYKFPFNGVYFQDLPIKLKAIPSPGYKFVKWEMGSMSSTAINLDYDMTEARTFRAYFEEARNTDTRIVINEINYSSSPTLDTKDWVELYNAGNSTVNLKDWILSDGGPEAGFVFPSDYVFEPGAYLVVCRDLPAFRSVWQKVLNSTGDFDFGLSSSGDNVNLYDPEANLVDFVSYGISAPWPSDAVSTGKSIELTDPFLDNNEGKNWKTGPAGGTPGTVNYNYTPADTTGNKPGNCKVSCFPNPFSDYTTLQLEIAEADRYRIGIYDIQGRLIRILSDEPLEPGTYFLDWHGDAENGSELDNGIYIIRLSGEKSQGMTRTMIVR